MGQPPSRTDRIGNRHPAPQPHRCQELLGCCQQPRFATKKMGNAGDVTKQCFALLTWVSRPRFLVERFDGNQRGKPLLNQTGDSLDRFLVQSAIVLANDWRRERLFGSPLDHLACLRDGHASAHSQGTRVRTTGNQ